MQPYFIYSDVRRYLAVRNVQKKSVRPWPPGRPEDHSIRHSTVTRATRCRSELE